ncbi:MAG: hypothetical protein KDE27_20880 [Planctomycetes bacterium]|nr:hypothetical protein [Planctomycetota bacterium]
MKTRFLSALLACALPLAAQDASAETELAFYKAFYLEKTHDYPGAMALYEKFLATAPKHDLAKVAAVQQYGLLNKTGKTKERDAFKTKFAALLADADTVNRPADAAGDAPARPPRGEGGPGGNMADRVAQLEERLKQAREEGDEEQVARLERMLERMKQMAENGGQGGPGQGGGQRGGFGGRRGSIFSDTKLTDMDEEQLDQFKAGLERMSGMLDRMRENLGEEAAKALETNMADLKKALDEGKIEDAEKARAKIRESMPRRGGRGGRGGGGDAGGGQNGGGQNGGGENGAGEGSGGAGNGRRGRGGRGGNGGGGR